MSYVQIQQQASSVYALMSLIHTLRSEDSIASFEELAKESLDIDFAEISQPEAQNALLLLNQAKLILMMKNEVNGLLPTIVFEALENVQKRLQPLEAYISGIAEGTMTNAEAEHKLLVWGLNQRKKSRLAQLADDL